METTVLKNSAAIDEFSHALRNSLGSNLEAIKIFGSVARGTAKEDSDIDVLIVVKKKDFILRQEVYDIAYEANLKYDVVLSPIIMTSEDYGNSLFQETLFYKNIQEEGVYL